MIIVGFLRVSKGFISFARPSILTKLMACALFATLSACQTINFGGTANSQDFQGQHQKITDGRRTLLQAGQEAEVEHKYDVAANAYGRLFERMTNDPEVLTAFIRTMRYSDRAAEIANYVETKTKHLMNNPRVKFEYGKALLAAGRKSEALTSLRDVALLMPDNWEVDSAIGITFDALGDFPHASTAYADALKKSPNNVVVLNNMAMSQAIAGQLDVAISTLENAANISRSNTHIRQNLALLYAVKGDVGKARTLAAMDLSTGDLETNLSFYRRFERPGHE